MGVRSVLFFGARCRSDRPSISGVSPKECLRPRAGWAIRIIYAELGVKGR